MSTYSADAPQIEIQVCNGGYVVHAWVRGSDGFANETSVFTDLNSVIRYLVRVIPDLEGPGMGEFGARLGRLKFPD